MKNKSLILGVIGILLLCTLFLISCEVKRPADTSTEPVIKEKIPFRITWTDYSGRGETIRKIVQLYNKKQDTKFEIVLMSGDEDLKAIEGLLDADGSNPILVLPYRYVKYLGDKGKLMKLTNSFQKEMALFYPELWKLGTVNDDVYGIPWLGHSICLLYNKNLLKAAGVAPESIRSLDSLIKSLQAVEAKTKAKGIGLVGANHNDISWMVNQFIYGFGSKLVDEGGSKVVVNNEKAKAAIDFYKNKLGPHAQPTWLTDNGVEVMNHFRNQEIAFEFQGIWGMTDIEKNGEPFEAGIINLEDIGLYAEVGPMMLSIPQNMSIEKQKEAVSFITFMISSEAQERIMDGEYSPEHDAYYPFRVPVRTDLIDSLVMKEYPQYQPFIRGFHQPSIDVPVPKWQIVKDTYYAPGLNKVMNSELTIEDFLSTIEEKGNEILDKD